jgi:hypothetical protein
MEQPYKLVNVPVVQVSAIRQLVCSARVQQINAVIIPGVKILQFEAVHLDLLPGQSVKN